jgi:hypothetical protein
MIQPPQKTTARKQPTIKPRLVMRGKSCSPDVRFMNAIAERNPLPELLAILEAWMPNIPVAQ